MSDEANAVRDGAELFEFPEDHIIRWPAGHGIEAVTLAYGGETRIWATHDAFRLDLLRDNHDHIDRHIETRVQARLDAAIEQAVAAERWRGRRDHRRLIERQFTRALQLAIAAAFFAFAVGLVR